MIDYRYHDAHVGEWLIMKRQVRRFTELLTGKKSHLIKVSDYLGYTLHNPTLIKFTKD